MTDYSDLVKRLRILQEHLQDGDAGEAADAIEAQAAEILFWKDRMREALKTIKENVGRIAELEAALKPFAECEIHITCENERCIWKNLTYGDLRQARKVLENA